MFETLDMGLYRELFFKNQAAHDEMLRGIEDRTNVLITQIEKRREGFGKALENFIVKNEVDGDYFQIQPDILAQFLYSTPGTKNCQRGGVKRLENENLHATKGSRKNPVRDGITIKKEKISQGYQSSESTSVSSTASSIKVEKEDMPPPVLIPPKHKGKTVKVEASSRSTRTKPNRETPVTRDSDVVIQNLAVPVVNLSDSEESDHGKVQKQETVIRSTRTKTRKGKANPQDSDIGSDAETTKSTKDEAICEMETRSTRTKTIRKGKKDDEPEIQQEVRSTRTKTIKKGAKDIENVETTSKDSVNDKEVLEEVPQARSTRTKTLKQAENTIDTIDSTTEIKMPEVTRSTRTKTRKMAEKEAEQTATANSIITTTQSKRHISHLSDKEQEPKRKTRSVDMNVTNQTEYEDARSSLESAQGAPPLNTTYVTAADGPKPAMLNATVTINTNQNVANDTAATDKPKFNIFNNKTLLKDDDFVEVKTPSKKQPTKSSKEVFSPYEKTTLKKKVEAFEKLQNCSEIPVKANNTLKPNTPSAVKEKAKLFTPLGSKFKPTSSSTSKVSRLINHQHSIVNNESLLAMKSVQKDSRDKQRRLLEREQALKKKEAMLQAQAEAKKKLNEEKQLKAQQQRKALEAEKQKQIELQKLKEERLKQREIEREEYLLKQKVEAEKKRLAQKKKIQELQAQREQIIAEQNRNPPKYMVTPLPELPTGDCYDSDDPDFNKSFVPPNWCSDDNSRLVQLAILAAGDKIKNTLFCRHPQTPDLKEIFEVIDPVKLKRSSSILWKQPPRYSMMPDLNETKFSEDDEYSDSD